MIHTFLQVEPSPFVPLVEPMTVEEVRRHLRLPILSPTDDDEDAYLESLIISAREMAEIHQNRDLIEKYYTGYADGFLCHEIPLRYPLQSVSRVRYRNGAGDYTTLLEGTDYIVDTAKRPGVVMPAYGKSWPSFTPWPSSAVEIDFKSGISVTNIFWGDAGQRVLQGMRLWISSQYFGRVPSGLDEATFMQRIETLMSAGKVSRA